MRHLMISGLTAAGKTTYCSTLALKLGLQYVSGSAIRAKSLTIPLESAESADFWRDDPRARAIDEERLVHPTATDTAVEDELVAIARGPQNCVFDTWALPWLFREEALCVYIRGSLGTRCRRIKRSHPEQTVAEISQAIEHKDRMAHEFFLRAYGVDIVNDLSPFDIIVDCDEADDEAETYRLEVSEQLLAIAQCSLTSDVNCLQHFLFSGKVNSGPSLRMWIAARFLNAMALQNAGGGLLRKPVGLEE